MYIVEYHLAIRKNEILSFTSKWIELEDIMLSEVSRVRKDKDHIFSFICGI
jgi:hypothetical protein